MLKYFLPGLVACFLSVTACADDHHGEEGVSYQPVTKGTRMASFPSGAIFKVLVEEANLGGDEVEIVEMTFPAGYSGGAHPHGSIEIFYVIEGQFGHFVNGEGRLLEAGEVGIVRPGDSVVHTVGEDGPAKVLTIWVPGGELERSLGGMEMTPMVQE